MRTRFSDHLYSNIENLVLGARLEIIGYAIRD
jgi:hypothetical protein